MAKGIEGAMEAAVQAIIDGKVAEKPAPLGAAAIEALSEVLALQGLAIRPLVDERTALSSETERRLNVLANDLEQRLLAGEEIIRRLEARRVRFEQLDPRLGNFQARVLSDLEKAGRCLDADEEAVLVMLVRGLYGLPFEGFKEGARSSRVVSERVDGGEASEPPADAPGTATATVVAEDVDERAERGDGSRSEAYAEGRGWGWSVEGYSRACERLHAMGYLKGPTPFDIPTLAGVRMGVMLWDDTEG